MPARERGHRCKMVMSGRILFAYMLLVYVQRCNSVQSSAFFRLFASGNPTLACNCTLGLAFLNLHVYNLNKDHVFSCQLMPLSYRCEENLLNYYNGMKNCHSKSHSSTSVQKNMFFEFLKMHGHTYRSPRFLAFFQHILTQNDRSLNLQATIRQFCKF